MLAQPPNRDGVRLAEVLAALSLAMDLGTGQPLEWVIRCCLMGVRLSEAVGLGESERRDVYYLSLLRHIGCTATATWEAKLFGDELGLGEGLITDSHQPAEALSFLFRMVAKGQPPLQRARYLGRALAAGPTAKDTIDTVQCQVAGQLAEKFGVEVSVRQAIGQVFERWDGHGVPNRLKAEAVARGVRVAQVAQEAVTVQMLAGPEAAVRAARRRANVLYDPAIVEVFCRSAPDLFAQTETDAVWEAVVAAEPGPPTWLAAGRFEAALEAIADFTDLKSPYLVAHSRGVAELAARAAGAFGLPDSDVKAVRWAGLLHDLGRVGVSAAIWNKPGPLSDGEWERVRLHTIFTERIFSRSAGLAPLGALAALHHERLDGSGYHRGLPAAMLAHPARLLAVSDAYRAMTETRPHRPALAKEAAAEELRREARAGRLDPEATNAVLSVAGHSVRPGRTARPPADLSKREIEVLRLIAQGLSTRQMAQQLSLSPKTVDTHIQHIYNKIGFSTRAAATLFALQNNLLA